MIISFKEIAKVKLFTHFNLFIRWQPSILRITGNIQEIPLGPDLEVWGPSFPLALWCTFSVLRALPRPPPSLPVSHLIFSSLTCSFFFFKYLFTCIYLFLCCSELVWVNRHLAGVSTLQTSCGCLGWNPADHWAISRALCIAIPKSIKICPLISKDFDILPLRVKFLRIHLCAFVTWSWLGW